MSLALVSQWLALLLAATTLPEISRSQSTNGNSQQPNIVFVLADDYGYNDIGYHSDQIRTPNMDAIAKSGVTLENYYVQPICTPTRSQLMTGRYQIHTGLQHDILHPDQRNGLPLDCPTIADQLRKSGYATHLVGKWHLGYYKDAYLPYRRGFDTAFGYLNGQEDYYTHYRPFGKKKIPYLDFRHEATPTTNFTGRYSTHLFTEKAIELVRNHNRSKPLFLYLALQATHYPLQVPKYYEDMYKNIKDNKRRVFAGMVAAMDEGIKNLTEALKETKMWDNTVFFFSTDNGGPQGLGANNFPLRGGKRDLFDGGMHGVGFVAGGRLSAKGQVNRQLIHVSDWYPTMLRLARSKVNVSSLGLDGVDQWDTINGGAASPRDVILHNIDPMFKLKGKRHPGYAWDTRVRAALRSGDFKVITGNPGSGKWVKPPSEHEKGFHYEMDEDPDKNLWLFNVAEDPNEHNDLSEEKPEVVRELLDLLVKFNATAVPVKYPAPDPLGDPGKHGGIYGPWVFDEKDV